MPWTDAGSVAVVVAHQFNPSIVRESWLLRHGILEEGNLQEGSIFTDMLVQVRSLQFHLFLIPDLMQFVPAVPADQQQQLIVNKVGAIIRTLPETPYRALGLNFNWHFTPDDGDMPRLTRSLFCIPPDPLYRRFTAQDARFGAYLSKDFAGFRLTLSILPIQFPPNADEHRLQFAFNFNFDLAEGESAAQIVDRLGHWNEVRQESEEIIEVIRQGHNL
jgi:hypothetical protein